MGIINTLLTGGMLIGKICQALSPTSANHYRHEGTGRDYFGAVDSGGITFFRSNEKDKGSTVYAFNTSTDSHAQISVPNQDGSSGLAYVIAPTQKIEFAESDSPLVSPTTEVVTGLIGETTNGLGVSPGVFRLAFKDLRLGSVVTIGSFTLSCTTGQLAIVSTALTASFITYLAFRSNKGVTAITTQNIPPSNPPKSAEQVGGSVTQVFPFDFLSVGIDPTVDSIDGTITLSIAATEQHLHLLSTARSQPVDEADLAFLDAYRLRQK